ncbi:MAG: hypothetical protein WC455_14735 [Dehalococcoidia bacterium]|jgi:hypothetical protein
MYQLQIENNVVLAEATTRRATITKYFDDVKLAGNNFSSSYYADARRELMSAGETNFAYGITIRLLKI